MGCSERHPVPCEGRMPATPAAALFGSVGLCSFLISLHPLKQVTRTSATVNTSPAGAEMPGHEEIYQVTQKRPRVVSSFKMKSSENGKILLFQRKATGG